MMKKPSKRELSCLKAITNKLNLYFWRSIRKNNKGIQFTLRESKFRMRNNRRDQWNKVEESEIRVENPVG